VTNMAYFILDSWFIDTNATDCYGDVKMVKKAKIDKEKHQGFD
jgi:hypothetical protein